MPITGHYVPSSASWVRDQVEQCESSGGTRATTLRDTGLPVVIVTYRGTRSGKVRKIGLMRVERDGHYALVASKSSGALGAAPILTLAGDSLRAIYTDRRICRLRWSVEQPDRSSVLVAVRPDSYFDQVCIEPRSTTGSARAG